MKWKMIEAVSADGDPVAVDFDASTGKFQIYPSYLRGMDAERSIAGIKVYFSTKHDDTHCLCGGTAYDGHDTHEEIEWKQWTDDRCASDCGRKLLSEKRCDLTADGHHACLTE